MTTKTFDAVEMMRELRDALSQDMVEMSSEERIRYIREKAAATPLTALFENVTGATPLPTP